MTALAAVLFLYSLSPQPEDNVAALYGEPDIYGVSITEYIGSGANNFEMKMLMNVYLDSLEVELNRLYADLREEFHACPDLLEALETSHGLFLEESRSWASLSEESMWWDTEEGIRYDGTARGYTYAFVLADALWNRINGYTGMLEKDRHQ